MGWEDRGWVLVDEHPVPDLAEGALGIFQRSKIQTLTRFRSAMGMFIFTSRIQSSLSQNSHISHNFHSPSPFPWRRIPPGRYQLRNTSRWSSGADWAALAGKLQHFVSKALTVERVLPCAVVCHAVIFHSSLIWNEPGLPVFPRLCGWLLLL